MSGLKDQGFDFEVFGRTVGGAATLGYTIGKALAWPEGWCLLLAVAGGLAGFLYDGAAFGTKMTKPNDDDELEETD